VNHNDWTLIGVLALVLLMASLVFFGYVLVMGVL